jgi:hypothetical protein
LQTSPWLVMTDRPTCHRRVTAVSGPLDGGKYLSVVCGLEVYPVDPFRNLLDRPDLVREKFAGDRQGTVRVDAAKLHLAHAVAAARLAR